MLLYFYLWTAAVALWGSHPKFLTSSEFYVRIFILYHTLPQYIPGCNCHVSGIQRWWGHKTRLGQTKILLYPYPFLYGWHPLSLFDIILQIYLHPLLFSFLYFCCWFNMLHNNCATNWSPMFLFPHLFLPAFHATTVITSCFITSWSVQYVSLSNKHLKEQKKGLLIFFFWFCLFFAADPHGEVHSFGFPLLKINK